ncbi:MAG: PAS domain S-box protein [Deltaproteobacteria bacterium]|nr:PAS domain S-box protein [Deltaproteobacteria bacterium]
MSTETSTTMPSAGRRDAVELLLAEAGCRALIEGAPDAAFLVDGGGRLCAVNDRAAALFGYERDAMLGLSLNALLPERSRDAHEAVIARLSPGKRSRMLGSGVTVALLHAEGFEFAVDIAVSGVDIPTGRVTWALVRAIGPEHRAAWRDLGGSAHPVMPLVPICAHCRSVHEADDVWRPLCDAVREYANAIFSHGICPECATHAGRPHQDG